MSRFCGMRLRVGAPYPLLFTLAWVLQVFSDSGEPVEYLWRPLLIIVGLVLLATVVIGALSSRERAALLTFSIVWFFFLKAWVILAALVALLVWRVTIEWVRRRQGRSPIAELRIEHITRLANSFATILFVVTLAGLVATFPLTLWRPAAAGVPQTGAPDIYLLMLDGYPRSDTLRMIGIDNSEFVRELEARGFSVSSASRTNYNTTVLSLAALFQGDYLPEDGGQPPPLAVPEAWELRQMSHKIQTGQMLAAVRGRGYEIATTPTVYGASALFSADKVLGYPQLTQLEDRYIYQSWLSQFVYGLAPGRLLDAYAESVDSVFDEARAFASTAHDRPAFLFMHALSPHPPFLFDAGGRRPDTSVCPFLGCGWGPRLSEMQITMDEYVPLLSGQIAYVDGRVIETVDAIRHDDPGAVIVVFSDHGARYETMTTDEYYHSLFAASTPNFAGLYPNDVALTNVLPVLLNAYFGTSYPIHDYQAWEYAEDGVHLLPRTPVAP